MSRDRLDPEIHDHLNAHLEEFMTAVPFDEAWDQALVHAPPRPTAGSRWLHAGAVIALAAAALLMAMPSQLPPPPETEGPRTEMSPAAFPLLTAAFDEVEAFDEVQTTDLDLAGLDRKEEDALLRDRLMQKAEALTRTEAAVMSVLNSEQDPATRVAAFELLAGVYGDMADSIADFTHPSYLSGEQAEVYQQALETKANTQLGKAEASYRSAAHEARLLSDSEVARLTALANDLQEVQAQAERSLAARTQRAQKTGKTLEPKLRALVAAVEERLERCKDVLDDGSVSEVQMVLDQVEHALDAQETALYSDLLSFVGAYDKGLQKSCPHP